MSQTALPRPGQPRSPWLIAAAVTLPAFMEVLDTSIANVALRYIAGGLSAASNDADWVITSYLASNAIVLPLAGWMSTRFGRRNYFVACVLVFTFASLMCGLAGSLGELILYRCIQGLAGGGLEPSTQGILLDAFPRERQGTAMTLFGVVILVAPIVGPTLGGWITDNYSWRWIFFLNVPVGVLAMVMILAVLDDPPYLVDMRARERASGRGIDAIGLGLIVIGFASLEVLAAKGQQWDWTGDPFGRVQALIAGMVIGIGGLVAWSLYNPRAIIDVRLFADRNFLAATIIIFALYAVLFGSLTLLPGLLQTLMGYNATQAGVVLAPGGMAAILLMPVVGWVFSRGYDARWFIAAGLVVAAFGFWWMSRFNLSVSPMQAATPRVIQLIGLTLIFAPLNTAAYATLSPEERLRATGLFNLLRNEGGSVGTSMGSTILERRSQDHVQRLGEHLTPLDPNLEGTLGTLTRYFLERTGDAAAAQQMAWKVIDQMRQQQAQALAYFDCFWLYAVLALAMLPLVLLMRRTVMAKGERVGGE